MDTIGIIAEYNPFHNGHQYQIETIKAQTGAQNIVIVMSGDFVQRGTPAWTDKYLRTQMALSCGADMVFELPVSFATASAETFARAGVSLLTSLSFVDGICFGSECDSLPLLQEIADFLVAAPASFDENIRTLTAKGISYPAARTLALNEHFGDLCQNDSTLFSSPNNILAIEYLKAIRQSGSHLKPFHIQRKDSGYHSENINTSFASATAIRKVTEDFLHTIAPAVPKQVLYILEGNTSHYPITEDDFSSLLYYRLSHLTKADTAILDMTEEILCRIQKMLPEFANYSDFTAKIKTKQYTYSRISRVLLHCLLNIMDFSNSSFKNEFSSTYQKPLCSSKESALPYVPYARLLGFRREKSYLLRNESKIPVITKPADGISQIQKFYAVLPSDHACDLFQKDISASNLYQQIQNTTLGCKRKNEYFNQPVML